MGYGGNISTYLHSYCVSKAVFKKNYSQTFLLYIIDDKVLYNLTLIYPNPGTEYNRVLICDSI